MSYDFDLFVIGGGSAGVRCARISAAHGARVGIAEERFWGGTCVNVGCVPKKLMVMASEYGHAMADAAGFGWEIGPATHHWGALIAAKNKEISRLNGIYVKLLEGAGATVFEKRTTFLDPHTLDVAGRRVTAENIVIAVGGRPMTLDCPGSEHAIVSDAAFFLDDAPKRVVMVGGGYISLEFACIFHGLGAQVDVVMRQQLPLRGFDEDIRTELADALTTQGIRLHPGAGIASIALDSGEKLVRLRDGSALNADLVFAAVGRVPLTETLGIDHAGVEMDGFGAVCVDTEYRTNQPHIYAIGDVTNRMNLTPVATAEGHSLADRLFGPTRRSWNFDAVASAVFTSPPVATVGLTEAQAAAEGSADIYCTRFKPMRHALSGRARKTFMKLVVDQQTQRVLGAHMVGEDAPEIMQGLSIAITAGATKMDFDRTVGIHPTAAEEFVTLRTRSRVAEGPRVEAEKAQLVAEEEIGVAEMGVGE
ncbi:MAG TPA: glutathione-disulfide reductase [Acetobacteraceae bacterium]|nr:glutathione-disulfide reductase [Acetobacteraceae bacterium]